MIKADPWKRVECDMPFDLPESCFIFDGNVARPPVTAHSREFSADKIRDIQILQNLSTEKTKIATLVIQYEHCIATASIKNNVFKIQCEPQNMVTEYQIRGPLGSRTIYFVEKRFDRSTL